MSEKRTIPTQIRMDEVSQEYRDFVDKFKPKKKDADLDFKYPFYIGKADMCVDLLKHFEPLEL